VEKLRMSSIWYEENEGMCTGYRYGTAFCIISYHLFIFLGIVMDYKIHMDMEIVIFA
jgi:hypothetical protein